MSGCIQKWSMWAEPAWIDLSNGTNNLVGWDAKRPWEHFKVRGILGPEFLAPKFICFYCLCMFTWIPGKLITCENKQTKSDSYCLSMHINLLRNSMEVGKTGFFLGIWIWLIFAISINFLRSLLFVTSQNLIIFTSDKKSLTQIRVKVLK